MDAGAAEKRQRGRFCEQLLKSAGISQHQNEYPYLDINSRNVANDIMLIIHDRERRNSFIVHKLERTEQRRITTKHRLVSFAFADFSLPIQLT